MDEAAHASQGGSARQCGRGGGLALAGGETDRAMGAGGKVDDDIDVFEMHAPIGLRADIADRAQCDPGDGLGRTPRRAEDGVAAPSQLTA